MTVFQHKFYYSVYHAVGWGVPVLMTAAWATATAMHYGSSRSERGLDSSLLTKFIYIFFSLFLLLLVILGGGMHYTPQFFFF